MATPFTVFSGSTTTLTNALLAPNSGISVSNIALKASGSSAVNFYDGSLAPLGIGSGLLLTSGTTPGTSNTAGWFGQSNNAVGDADIDAVVNTVFKTQSYDATTLSFDFTVSDTTATSITFDLVMGSDEYPEWVNSFVDSAVVIVNGVNYALFNHNSNNPLSVVSQNLAAGYFQNNANNVLPIEYDGVSQVLKIVAPINAGGALNHIKIGVADTGDHVYDTGLFIANLSAGNAPGSGIVVAPPSDTGSTGNDNLTGTAKDEYFDLKAGDDTVYAGIGDDIVVAGAGNDVIFGGSGNDQLEGDEGNDDIDGGDGSGDTTIYTGKSADYTVTKDASGSFYSVTALDGSVDTLKNIEIIKFSDGTVNLVPLATPVVSTPAPIATVAPAPVVVPVTVVAPPPAPVIPANKVGTVFVSGVGSLGQKLTATVSDQDGTSSSAISYQWQFSHDGYSWTDIAGATSSSYFVTTDVVPASGVDSYVQVITDYVDNAGNLESPTSASKVILEANNGDFAINLLQLSAPAGASVMSPLTTLVNNAVTLGLTPNEASVIIKTVLGIDKAKLGVDVDLLHYDAWAILQDNLSNDPTGNTLNATALKIEKKAVQVAIMTSLGSDDTGIALTEAILLANSNKTTLNLTDLTTVANLLGMVVADPTNPKDPTLLLIHEIWDRSDTVNAAKNGIDKNGLQVDAVTAINTIWLDMQSGLSVPLSDSISTLSSHINQAPTGNASANFADAVEDTDYTISAADLLTGFTDSDGGTLQVIDLTVDSNAGSIVQNGSDFIFVPNPNYNGPVELTYNVVDGQYDQYGNEGSIAASQFFVVKAVNDAPTGGVTISNTTTATVGDILSAANTLSDADGTSKAVLSYQWQSDGVNIDGATAETYTLTPKEAGTAISVVASYTDDQGSTESVASSVTNAIIDTTPNPVPTPDPVPTPVNHVGVITVSGDFIQGGTLQATVIDVDGLDLANVSYQWEIIDENNNTTILSPLILGSDSYTLTQDAVGKLITVSALYTDAKGNNEQISVETTTLVANVNDVPTLTDFVVTLADGTEDTAYILSESDLLAGFSDVDTGDILAISGLVATQGGNLSDNGDGTWNFSPTANYNGVVDLSYSVVDNNGGSTVATQNFYLVEANDAPALTGTNTVLANGVEDIVYTLSESDLLAGFSDVDTGDILAISGLVATQGGNLSDNGDGTWDFSPTANYNGTVSLSYDVIDGNGGILAATQSFNLAAANDAPTGSATAVLAQGLEDTIYTINAADLLAGFSDIDTGDILAISGLEGGNLSDNGDGTWDFSPTVNYNGTVSLSYDVIDGNGGILAATQSFNLAAANDAPTGSATAVLAQGLEDTIYTINATDLLAGFSDIDTGDILAISGLVATQGGNLSDNGNGTWNFSPTANYNGTVSLSYDVIDGNGGILAATQSFNLAAANDAPTGSATAVLAQGLEDTIYTINATDLLAGFSDIDTGDILAISGLVATQGGNLSDNGDGTWDFSPTANYNGAIALSYNVIDGNGGILAATQSFNLAAANDAPTGSATAVLAQGLEDTVYTINATDLLAGFSDIDTGDILAISGLVATQGGNLSDNGDGTWDFSPTANYNGTASLSYDVIDGNGGILAATQSFNLAAANDAPTGSATAVLAQGLEDTIYTINATDLLAGFSDIDTGDILAISGLVATQGGNLSDNGDGTWNFSPTANYNGTVSLSYDVIDGNGGILAATQSFNLAAANDAPTGSVTISGSTVQGQLLTANNNLADVDGLGTISYQWLVGGTPINGATANAYTLTQNEVGKTVRVIASYTDLQGTKESVASALTANVTNPSAPVDGKIINGTKSNNKLVGSNGNDWLTGGKGDDTLTGGAGSDHFLFVNRDGEDKILDFNISEDFIHIASNMGIKNDFADVIKHAHAKTNGVQIDFVEGKLLLVGVSLDDLKTMPTDHFIIG